MIREIERKAPSGYVMLLLLLGLGAGLGWSLSAHAQTNPPLLVAHILGLAVVGFLLLGFFIVQPNQGRVLQLFGRYVGTVREPGLRWANPFFTKKAISLRVRNFETAKLKVNDSHGNPIEIAAVVVWRVTDTAEAAFEVDDYADFLAVQSEAAVRSLASSYPYDAHEEGETSLVGNLGEISDRLREENQKRLDKAGLEIIESRITHLAYAPEIAQAMLRRQQAGAVIAARQQIVDGAVGMVEHALAELSSRSVVQLDDERRAVMVSNLLAVLCSETATQPIINTGTLY